MLSSTVDLIVALASVIIAPFVVQGLIRAKGTVGRILQLLLGLGVATVFVVVWAYFGHDPLQIVYCTLDKSAPSCSRQTPISPTLGTYGKFSDLDSLRDALNGLTEETPDAKLVELFGAPTASVVAKKPYRGEQVTLNIYNAGPFLLFVARSATHHIGYGISAGGPGSTSPVGTAPEWSGKTPTLLLSRGGGAGGSFEFLETLNIGRINQYCEGKLIEILGRFSWPSSSPPCFFGRAGQYAHYSFLYQIADFQSGAGSKDPKCQAEFHRLEMGAFSDFKCSSINALTPTMMFMSKADDVNLQEWLGNIVDYQAFGGSD